jgi:peptide/nickel transport system ATP-binding protein
VSGTPLLRVRELAVEFAGARRVVDGFGIEVAAGEIVGLMGQPGCGKSTAALAMLGLARGGGRITGGTVEFEGVARAAADDAAMQALRGRRIGFVTQSARAALHPLLDVGTQIANVVMAHEGVSRRDALARRSCFARSASTSRSAGCAPTCTSSPPGWRSAW